VYIVYRNHNRYIGLHVHIYIVSFDIVNNVDVNFIIFTKVIVVLVKILCFVIALDVNVNWISVWKSGSRIGLLQV